MLCAAPRAAAHGFGQRFDLPLPLELWLAGAGATIVVTFVVMALFVREVRLSSRPLFRLGNTTLAVLRLFAVLIFVLSLVAGFFGSQDPYHNLLPTMVWVLWWVGFAFVCALVVDLWALVNPLRTLFPGSLSVNLPYPAWLGAWPAVLLFLGFAWAELVWPDNDVPSYLACAVLGYGLFTWTGMFLFGRETWLAHGEAFSIAFGILGRFAPLEVAAGEVKLRPPGAGLAAAPAPSFSLVAFVLLMLATVSFDGFLETPLYQRVATNLQGGRLLFELSEMGLPENEVIATFALLAFPLTFLAVYWLAAWAMARLGGAPSVSGVARAFVLSLVPIAVAYHLSHYFSLLVTAGQFIVPLASDPFGFGWDLFGTARTKVDLGLLSPYVFWYGAVVLIVAGHAIAVFVAHLGALRILGSRGAALASQVPMVGLMVAYTMLSLWILAQPIVG